MGFGSWDSEVAGGCSVFKYGYLAEYAEFGLDSWRKMGCHRLLCPILLRRVIGIKYGFLRVIAAKSEISVTTVTSVVAKCHEMLVAGTVNADLEPSERSDCGIH